jgi:hypothetical protein
VPNTVAAGTVTGGSCPSSGKSHSVLFNALYPGWHLQNGWPTVLVNKSADPKTQSPLPLQGSGQTLKTASVLIVLIVLVVLVVLVMEDHHQKKKTPKKMLV